VEFAFFQPIIEPIWVYAREVWGEMRYLKPIKVNALGYPREVWGEMANYH
jgi:hypothetical protein